MTFERVTEVVAGASRPSALEQRRMARSLNQRILWDAGNGVFRICWGVFSAFRGLLAGSGLSQFSGRVFFNALQMMDPGDGEYPVVDAGLPGGVNVANPLGAHIFGVASAGIEAEAKRLSTEGHAVVSVGVDGLVSAPLNVAGVPLWPTELGGSPVSVADHWKLGKMQRGLWDPASLAEGAPAMEAGQSHERIRTPLSSLYHKGWGNFLPNPAFLGWCGALDEWGQAVGSYELVYYA